MIPLSVGNLTIEQFNQFTEIAKTGKSFDIITFFTGKTEDDLNNLPINKLEKLNHRVGFLLSDYNDMLNRVNKYRVKKYLFVKGRIYKAQLNEKKLNTNQYTALKTFDASKQLNDVCSVIYTPLKGFDKNKTDEISEAFKKVKVKKVIGTVFFYTDVLKKQRADLKASLIQAKLNLMEQLIQAGTPQEVLDKAMAGITL